MRHQQREDVRAEKMMISTKRAIEATVVDDEVEKLPGPSRERLGEIRALVGVSDLTRLAAIKLIQDLKQECLERRINWEQVCEESLPKCRRSIDHYLDTLETFGDGMYEAILDVTTRAERVQARRMLKSGDLRLEGDCLVIAGRRVRNVPEEAHTVLEIIRESLAREEAAKEDAKKKGEQLKQHQEMARKHAAALIAARDTAIAEKERIEALPVPREMGTEADRRRWNQLKSWQTELEHLLESFDGLIDEDEHSREFWGEAITWLGWLQLRIHTLGLRLLGRRGNMVAELTLLGEPPRVALPQGEWPARTLEAQAERLLQDAAGTNISGA